MVVPHHICVAAAHGNVEQLRAYFSAGDRDPNDMVSFWRPNREWWWSDYRYSRVNRYDAPWMG